jgi:hypothetical protein
MRRVGLKGRVGNGICDVESETGGSILSFVTVVPIGVC